MATTSSAEDLVDGVLGDPEDLGVGTCTLEDMVGPGTWASGVPCAVYGDFGPRSTVCGLRSAVNSSADQTT